VAYIKVNEELLIDSYSDLDAAMIIVNMSLAVTIILVRKF